jgi:hypothetical protein
MGEGCAAAKSIRVRERGERLPPHGHRIARTMLENDFGAGGIADLALRLEKRQKRHQN